MSSQLRPRESFINKPPTAVDQAEIPSDPWRNDVYVPTETSGFQILSGTASTIRRRYSYVPVGIKKADRFQSAFPFNWLQLVNIFLGTLSLLLFVKLIIIVLAG